MSEDVEPRLVEALERPNPVVDPTDHDAVTETLARLASDDLELVGQLVEASNAVFLGLLGHDKDIWRVVYKPTCGERPLADFPPATLAQRETGAFVVSHLGGYAMVPPTVLRHGPLGPGSVQLWVDHDEDATAMVDVVAPGAVEPGWIPVFAGETPEGEEVVVAHTDDESARRLAVLDAVLNNADRKGSHVLVDSTGRRWGIDHGITLHAEPKLRTVLWGWVGDPLPDTELERLAVLDTMLHEPGSALLTGDGPRSGLLDLVSDPELEALRARVGALLATGTFPEPHPGHYPIPWPPL